MNLGKILFFFILLFSNAIYGEEKHWAIGGWDCRSWGAIRLLEDRYAIDLDPEGCLNNWGVWQDFDENSVLIVWMESNKVEIIVKDKDKFYTQSCFGFGMGSVVEETKKILK